MLELEVVREVVEENPDLSESRGRWVLRLRLCF